MKPDKQDQQTEPHREFLILALRAAATRARLIEAEINTIGVALKSNLIGPGTAVQWIYDSNLVGMVGALPETTMQLAPRQEEKV